MTSPKFPVTDDHIHIDPVNGRGLDAARDFLRAGGTHMFLVSKPSWSLGVSPSTGTDYRQVFDETIRVAGLVAGIDFCRAGNGACRLHGTSARS